MGWALRSLVLSDSNGCLKDRKVSGRLIRKCAPGSELVEWLMNLSPVVHTRIQATGMFQALLEEGVISHGKNPSLHSRAKFEGNEVKMDKFHQTLHE